MSSAAADESGGSVARVLPTSDELREALKIEVFDRVGAERALGDIIEGKRSVLIFTRHFCMPEVLGLLISSLGLLLM